MRRFRILPLSLVVLAMSCDSPVTDASDAVSVDTLSNGAIRVQNTGAGEWERNGLPAWELVQDLRIGRIDGEGPDVFGSVRDVIPDELGRIWVMDSQAHELRLFGSDGRFVRTVGGEGDGPGEFGFNPCASVGPRGEVWVEAGGRWQRFDTAGVLLGGQQVTRSLGCGFMGWRSDELIALTIELGEDRRDRTRLFILHERGEDGEVTPRDTLPYPVLPEGDTFTWTGDGVAITGPVPLIHRATFTLGPRGDLWITEGDGDYGIRRQSVEGDTLLVVERTHEPIAVPDSVRDAEIEGLNREGLGFPEDFDRDDVPRVFPPFDRMYLATDGTLWVRRQVEGGAYSLDVFDPDGVYLGPVETFDGFGDVIIHRITSTHVYARVNDDFDVPYVVRWRIAGRQR